jgi:hypothetical protein
MPSAALSRMVRPWKVMLGVPAWSTKPADAEPFVPSTTGVAPVNARIVVLPPVPGSIQKFTVSEYVPLAIQTVSPCCKPLKVSLIVLYGLAIEPSPPAAAEALTYQSAASADDGRSTPSASEVVAMARAKDLGAARIIGVQTIEAHANPRCGARTASVCHIRHAGQGRAPRDTPRLDALCGFA